MEPIFKITDDRFDADQIDLYDLKIEWQDCRLKIALKNARSNTFIWFEDYFLGSYATFENSVSQIREIFNAHAFLKANFWNSIVVSVDTPLFLRLENELFDDQIPPFDYLKMVFPHLESSDFEIIESPFDKVRYLFGIPKVILNLLSEIYQNKTLEIKPKLANLAEFFNKNNQLNTSNLLIVNDKWIDTIITKNTEIEIRKFPSVSNEINPKVFTLLNSNGKKTYLFGEITPFSAIYKVIKANIEQVEIGKLPDNIKFSQYFDEVPEQRHLSLFV